MISRLPRLLAVGLALLLAACDTQQDAAKEDGPFPALWEIADSEGTVEGWMFGTIHALPDGSKRKRGVIGVTGQAVTIYI